MKNNSEDFIENRIRWRLERHKIPTAHTNFWDRVNDKPEIELSPDLGKPILLSKGNDSNYILLCVSEYITHTNGNIFMGKYEAIDAINDIPLREHEEKMDLSRLMIKLKSGKKL